METVPLLQMNKTEAKEDESADSQNWCLKIKQVLCK